MTVALYPIVKESFQLCYDITEIMAILIERFMELDIPEMVKVHDIFSRVSKQYDEVDAFYTWCKTAGIARSSEYPEVEKISQKRLDMMDDYIRERSIARPKPIPDPDPELEPEPEEDLSTIKALPPPEEPVEEKIQEENVEVEEPKEEKRSGQEEGDLLNLGEDAPTVQEHGDKLALALFDGALATAGGTESKTTPWEAFKESSASGDWETALVQSVSHLSNQKVSLPGGFDTLILDGMYQQGAMNQAAASSGLMATGSASSAALGSAGRPAMLALPAPPSADQGGAANTDPFAASLAVPPPPYVQMSEMEKKHNFLVQEQVMWKQYERDGRQGPAALAKANHNSNTYNAGGGYTTTYRDTFA